MDEMEQPQGGGSVLDRLGKVFPGRGRTPGFSRNTTFRLTEQGRDKLTDGGNDPKVMIMFALESRGSLTQGEIATTSGVRTGQVERLIPKLVKSGYIQPTSGGSNFDEV